jgi:hypothetical protein
VTHLSGGESAAMTGCRVRGVACAEEEFRELLTGLRRRLGPDHPDTLEAMAWIRSLPFLSSGALPGSRRT